MKKFWVQVIFALYILTSIIPLSSHTANSALMDYTSSPAHSEPEH